jgi:NAD(P)H-flavin reductase
MSTGKGQVLELILEDGYHLARVACPPNLIPSPGQYLLAGDGSDSPLPVPLFHTDFVAQGFIAAAPIPDSWNPGREVHLRGPLGRGFALPLSARKVGLVAFDDSPARLKGLIRQALKQDAAVVLVCDSNPDELPDEVEVQPVFSLPEIVDWADYVVFDVARENLNQLKEKLGQQNPSSAEKTRLERRRNEGQILIRTPIPCGGIADCGVCAVTLRSDWKLACKDGPVFDWKEILE